jgi:prevent-host-death family protein
MKPEEVLSISKFKATCLAVLEKVKRTGQPVLITKHGEPIAVIEPSPPKEMEKSWLGSFKGSGKITGDIVSPVLAEKEWRVLIE